MRQTPRQLIGWMIGVIVVGTLGWYVLRSDEKSLGTPSDKYETLDAKWQIADVAEGLGQVTRVKLSPDNKLMLVTDLLGDIWALARTKTGWVKQPEVFYHVDGIVNSSGENGMTGLMFSSQYASNKAVFVTYTKSLGGNVGENQVMRLKVVQQDGQYRGAEPQVIFRGNTRVSGAHQIQGGTGLMIDGKPHLLFPIGEGYQEHYARDLQREAGKIILIQEDGSAPLGVRPYPDFPKIQAIGIRNVYDMTLDPVKSGWVYFTQNGPDKHDVLIHAPLLDGRQYDFNWRSESNPATLLTPLVDGQEMPEYIIRDWEVTVSPNDVIATNAGEVFVTILSSSRYPNKEVIRGVQDNGVWSWEILTRRKANVDGGNPLGLALAKNGTLYVGDIYDGAVYALNRK